MKTSLAVICGSALVTLGAVGGVLVQGQTQITSSGTMSMGETSTQVTPPSTPDTAAAQPAVKAGGGG